MASTGYDFEPPSFAQLLLAKFYPEKTDKESALIRDYLVAHLAEFDRVSFSVRVGQGAAVDPTHLPAVQKQQQFVTQKRIDVVGWNGNIATLIEAKTHVSHEVLGQLVTDRHLWLEQYPDAPEPRLVAIGRTANDDALRALGAVGIDVYLYETTAAQ